MSEINPRVISNTIDKLTDDLIEARTWIYSTVPFTGKSAFLMQVDKDVIEAKKLQHQLLKE